MTNHKAALALLLSATLLGACGGAASHSDSTSAPAAERARGGWLGGDDDLAWEESGGGGEMAADATASAGKSARTLEASGAPAPGVAPDAYSSESLPYGDDDVIVPPTQRQGPGLQAGSVDDNQAFADYLKYRDELRPLGLTVHDVDVSERHVVTVVDANGRPLLGAAVKAGGQEVRTAADGRALLFGPVNSASVHYGDTEVQADFDQGSRQHRITVPVEQSQAGRAKLDVLFLIDTTGSMGDEIDRLKESVRSVASRIAALPSQPDLHLGMTVYRDRGDLFVTRTFDFTSDVTAFHTALAAVQAGGGGDTPEDLSAGLHEAVTAPAWRGDDAVKLVFLIADAPPHLDYQGGPDYVDDVRTAARKGIKLMPIASSGLDDQGEYIFRQLAQLTMGRFTFLTYGADGASPGTETDHHVSDYAVLALDDLVVRLVTDELGPLTGPAGGQ